MAFVDDKCHRPSPNHSLWTQTLLHFVIIQHQLDMHYGWIMQHVRIECGPRTINPFVHHHEQIWNFSYQILALCTSWYEVWKHGFEGFHLWLFVVPKSQNSNFYFYLIGFSWEIVRSLLNQLTLIVLYYLFKF